jgi:hypothetical protein
MLRVLFDAVRASEIADALAHRKENPYRPRVGAPPNPPRPLSDLPHGPRQGWATADEIQLMLKPETYGVDARGISDRWIRERLLKLRVPSEVRIVKRAQQRVFPFADAIAALLTDPLFRKKTR